MADVAVICPVLARPGNAAPLAASLYASTDRARLVFVASMADTDEQFDACAATGAEVLSVEWKPGRADYAKKIQAGYDATQEPLILLGADDLRFHNGWLEAIETVFRETDAGVVSTNDLGNRAVMSGSHATHPVVRRSYIDECGGVVGSPGTVYCQEYDHQLCDVELVETAKARGCYEPCLDAKVEHLHFLWGKAKRDATYDKGQARGNADRRLYNERRHLWEDLRVELRAAR